MVDRMNCVQPAAIWKATQEFIWGATRRNRRTVFVAAQQLLIAITEPIPCFRLSVLIKSFFDPSTSQHTQCPCRFFILERYNLCGNKTTTQRYMLTSGRSTHQATIGSRNYSNVGPLVRKEAFHRFIYIFH